MEQGPRLLTESDITVLTTTKQTQFGAVGQSGDGRLFRYVGFGGTATIAPGQLLVASAVTANSTSLAIPTQVAANLIAGSYSFNITNGATAVTQDQFAEGFVEVRQTSGTSNGPILYKVRGNSSAGSAGVITVFLYEPLRNASTLVAGTDTVNLAASIYSAVVPTLTQSAPAGVSLVQIPNTASVTNYGWVQTKGSAFVSATSATKGQAIKQDSTTNAGFVATAAAATDTVIGYAKETAISSTAHVILNIL